MKEREPRIRVHVIRSSEAIDADRWADQYVALCLRILRPDLRIPEAA